MGHLHTSAHFTLATKYLCFLGNQAFPRRTQFISQAVASRKVQAHNSKNKRFRALDEKEQKY
jgi:hypothetical protein